MKEKNSFLKVCMVLRKISLFVFGISALWLLGKTLKLCTMYYSRSWFTEAEWEKNFRYTDYEKWFCIVGITALVIFIITSLIKKRKHL